MGFLHIRITDEMKEQFREYCKGKGTTISTIILDYINILISEANEDHKDQGNLPGEKKISVKRTSYYCPYCGSDLSGFSDKKRKKHEEKCKNRSFRSKKASN